MLYLYAGVFLNTVAIGLAFLNRDIVTFGINFIALMVCVAVISNVEEE